MFKYLTCSFLAKYKVNINIFFIFTIDKSFNLFTLSSNLVLLNSVGVIYETDNLTLHSIRV